MTAALVPTAPRERSPYRWLAVTMVLTLFAGGRVTVPLLAWLAPIFALRFTRTVRRAWIGYALIGAVAAVSLLVGWRGMIPLAPAAKAMLVVGNAVAAGLPYAVDRALRPRLSGWLATLPFPLATTVIEFANMGSGSPVGSFGSTAYSQAGQVVLLQILSVTGIWGLTFLMAWLAPLANWAWEEDFARPTVRRAGAAFGGVMAAVLIFGGARLALAALAEDDAPGTVRVASFTELSIDFARLMPMLATDRSGFAKETRALHDGYFRRTAAEAGAGAKIVLWPEGAGVGIEEDEPALIAAGKAAAKDGGIYLAIPFFTMYRDRARPPENKLLVFDPAGGLALEHVKYGGNVFEGSKKGDGVLRTVETPYGTLSGVICWDTDFIRTIAQAGRNGTDILLSPAHDWRELDPLHGEMTAFRAIENGITVVRQADLGWSVVTDPYGRTLASMDHFRTTDRTMIAQVPVRGVRTVYAMIGDLFAWLAVAGLALVAAWAWRPGRR